MTTFAVELKTKIAGSGIKNIAVYCESFPAPQSIGTHTVCIISSGETIGFSVNYVTITKRIVVSGTAKSAIEKAEEIAKYLVPDSTTDPDTAFVIGEYAVMATFIDKRPSLIGNTNNIFLADFVARFLVIQGS